MANGNDEKDALRRVMKARRKRLGADAKAAADAAVCSRLAARRDIGEAVGAPGRGGFLAVYLATGDEIDIDPYIAHQLRRGVALVAPRWNGKTYELARLKGLDAPHLRRGPMGIREPVDADVVPPNAVPAWIIPGLAFTRDGRRLGYGGGWYDQLLASAPPSAVKLGVAYSFQVVDELPAEPYDIALSGVVEG